MAPIPRRVGVPYFFMDAHGTLCVCLRTTRADLVTLSPPSVRAAHRRTQNVPCVSIKESLSPPSPGVAEATEVDGGAEPPRVPFPRHRRYSDPPSCVVSVRLLCVGCEECFCCLEQPSSMWNVMNVRADLAVFGFQLKMLAPSRLESLPPYPAAI
jgi:hypothetical protein